MRLGGRAISPVVATVILTSIMLTTVAVAVYFSTSLIDAHRQMMEYESAKELLTYAATAIEQVALGSGGARYVRFSLTSTGLNFEQAPYALQITLRDETYSHIYRTIRVPINRVSVCAGPLVTTVDKVLIPEGGTLAELDKLIVEAGEPITLVYENFNRRACAYLEARRIRAVQSGVTYAQEEGQLKPFNFFTIHLVNVTFGSFGGAGTIPVTIRNKEISVYEYRFPSSSIIVTAKLGSHEITQTLTGTVNGGSIVIIKISRVEVSSG